MNEYKIDKGIPIPALKRGRPISSGFAVMEIGDSLFMAGRTSGGTGGFHHRLKPKKFVARNVTENGVKGVRVWRVE